MSMRLLSTCTCEAFVPGDDAAIVIIFILAPLGSHNGQGVKKKKVEENQGGDRCGARDRLNWQGLNRKEP